MARKPLYTAIFMVAPVFQGRSMKHVPQLIEGLEQHVFMSVMFRVISINVMTK